MPSPLLKMTDIHGLGHEPDLYDYRDKYLSLSVGAGELPDKVEQFDGDFPIYDQGRDNACVGFAYKEAAQIVLKKTAGLTTSLSPGFLWWLGRAALGWTQVNSGCRIRDVIRAANEYGVPSSGTAPWAQGRHAETPSAEAFAQAKDHPALDYEVVETVQAARIALALGFPVIFGTVLTESFDLAGRRGGFFPKPEGDTIGGHAMLLVGYSDTIVFEDGWGGIAGGFRYRNSWSARWGDQGWGWLPYAHFASPAVSDAWVLRGIRK